MFALPGIILLILTIYLRPQEIFPVLQTVPLLHLFMGLSIFGIFLDWRLRLSRPTATPQLGWAVVFTIWCLITQVLKAPPDGLIAELIETCIPLGLFLIIAHGVQTFRALAVVAVTLLMVCLFLSWVGIDQRFSEKGCHVLTGETTKEGTYDGRPCNDSYECAKNDPEPGADYTCEYVGPFGTSSVGLRVRYRGVLADPNELSLAICIGLPFAFALVERRKNAARFLLLAVALGLVGTCTVFTQSRGGQLVMLSVLGTYFVKRYGLRGMIIAGVAAIPMLLFGGRSGTEAAGSSVERMECWYVGTEMFRENPILGVGKNLFVEHHFLTAHNSYVLAPAETGLLGYWVWSCLLYISIKIPWTVVRRGEKADAEGHTLSPAARTWALAILAGTIGVSVGIFFLSFCYHYVLWIYFGLCGALYTAVRTHDPGFEVKLKPIELVGILVANQVLTFCIWFYTQRNI
jgi:hypothetical protein